MLKQKQNFSPQADQSTTSNMKTGKQIIKLGVFLTLSVLAFLSYTYFTQAQIPDFVNYQGRLRDSAGAPITAATTIQFSLYNHLTNGGPGDVPGAAGPLLWTETYDGAGGCTQITPGDDGIFAQHLGDCVSFPDYLDFTQEYYLGVKIGADAEASPRVPLSTHPYAFTSKRLHVEGGDLFITNTDAAGSIVMSTAGGMSITGSNAGFQGAVYDADYSANFVNRSIVDKEYVDEQLMWEIVNGGERIQPKNNSVKQIFVEENSNSYTQFKVRNNNDAGNGAGAIIELKGSGADYTNNMYIGKYGASFWIPELRDNGAVLTDKNLVVGTASAAHEIHFVTGNSYSDLRPVVVADNEGFRYTSDLSANFVDRTLVDKGYVDSAIIANAPTIYNADGTINGDRFVTVTGGELIVSSDDNIIFGTGNAGSSGGFSVSPGSSNFEAALGLNRAFVDTLPTMARMVADDSVNMNSLAVGSSIVFTDAMNSRGVIYATDYAANFVDRSLVDKGYVDTHQGTLQQVIDSSFAADGEILGDFGALLFNDDGGVAEFKTKSGGSEINFTTGDTQLLLKSEVDVATPALMQFRDNRAVTVGLQYEVDYSAGFTDRTLVDKEYVDGAIVAANVTASNGLTKTGNDIRLGGTLAGDTYIDHNGSALVIRDVAGEPETELAGDVIKINNITDNRQLRFGAATATSTGVQFVGTNQHNLLYRDNHLRIESDLVAFTGMQYALDYSANFVDRTLVDKGYVDGAIIANAPTLYNANGTLSGNRTLAGNNHTLNFSGMSDFNISTPYMFVDTGLGAELEIDAGVITWTSAAGQLYLDASDMTVFDYRLAGSRNGLEYDADYSANYTNRSLVDKEYVDSKVGSSIFDTDLDTGIQVERTADDDNVYFQVFGHDIMQLRGNSDGSAKEIYFGDYLGEGNETKLEISDVGSSINFNGLSANFGDIEGNGNETFLSVDDITQTITATNASLSIVQNGAGTGELRFVENTFNGANYVGFKTISSLTGNTIWTLPSADGAANEVLYTNGAGVLDWKAATDNNIYNSDGTIIGGDRTVDINGNYLNFNNTNLTIEIGEDEIINTIHNGATISEFEQDDGSIIFRATNGTDAVLANFRNNLAYIERTPDDGTTKTTLTIGTTNLPITSTVAGFQGAIYGADYSANYTNRSLVDKEYVDDSITASNITASNGLTRTGNDIRMGGTLTSDTTITGPANSLSVTDVGKFEAIHGVAGVSDAYYLGVDGTGSGFGVYSVGLQNSGIRINPTQMLVVDQNNAQGIVYANNYSANYIDRSLVDKEYVDDAIIAGSNNIYTANGTLAANRAVDLGTHQLFIDGFEDGTVRFITGDDGSNQVTVDHTANYWETNVNGNALLRIANNGTTYTDNGNFGGIKYAADYAVDFTNRSLVDKEYVDSNIGVFENNVGIVRNKGTHATDDFVFGSSQLDDDGDATHDSRMFFDKSKSAFRAGNTVGVEWNEANIGDYSAGFGYRNTIDGDYAFSSGHINNNSGHSSVAMGYGLTVSGNYSVAMGLNNQATNHSSSVFGTASTATGISSFAAGNNVDATGDYSNASGYQTTASGLYSTAMGWGIEAGSAGVLAIALNDQTGTNCNQANSMCVMGGNVGVGTPTPSAQLHTTGTVRFATFGAGTLTTDASGNVTASSDERLKNIKGVFNKGLEELLNINPIEYKWKEKTGYDTENSYYGFSAQNVQLSIPEAIGEDNRGYLTIADRPILATAINAIKELNQKQEESNIKIESNALKTDQSITTLTELQTSVDSNLAIINTSLTNLGEETKDSKENIKDNKKDLTELSENINSLTELTTTLTDTVANHEERIAQIEVILEDGGVVLNNTELPEVLQIFADNLETLEEDGEVRFNLEGELVVEKLKAEEIETGEITINNHNKSPMVGVAIIEKGEIEVRVETTKIKENSHILLTPHDMVNTALGEIEETEYFTIRIAEPMETDVKVEWFIIQEK